MFVPFVSDVRIGAADLYGGASMELDDSAVTGGSPPRVTPPSSPNVNCVNAGQVRSVIH